MIRTLTSPRLQLRPLELADAAQAQVLFPRWEIVRYMKAVVPWPYEPSRRISLHEGMRLVATEERDFVSGRLPSETWELTADEWWARRFIIRPANRA